MNFHLNGVSLSECLFDLAYLHTLLSPRDSKQAKRRPSAKSLTCRQYFEVLRPFALDDLWTDLVRTKAQDCAQDPVLAGSSATNQGSPGPLSSQRMRGSLIFVNPTSMVPLVNPGSGRPAQH